MLRTALALLLLGSSAFTQTRVDKVIAAAKEPAKLESNLRVLTDEIGGRVPGTPAMDKALEWAVMNFKDAGADSVTVESFAMPLRWEEGETRITVTAPSRFSVRAVSMAWAPPYQASSVRFVDVGEGDETGFAKAKDVAGAVLLVHSNPMKSWDDLFAEYMRTPAIIDRAVKAKAAGLAVISTRERDLLYRHINTTKIAPLPMVILAREDGQRVARLLTKGPVTAQFSVPNKVGPGFQSSNVIAEIRGSEKPKEFVILGAHLDSWELGTGALDNGCDAALVVEALRAIKKSGIQPKRTIKFMLYSGEEQGMIGSGAWERKHRAEMDNIVADVVFDTGTGKLTGYSLGGRKDIVDAVKQLTAPVRDLGMQEMTTDAFVGTDNIHLLWQGVPTLVANQKEENYLENYHASSDTFDKVDFAHLKDNVVVAAATVFAIADADERIGKRQSLAEVEALVKETGLDEQMRVQGMWPQWEEIKAARSQR
jgi:Zn-dependent M28 family amino/carboxypeptidase